MIIALCVILLIILILFGLLVGLLPLINNPILKKKEEYALLDQKIQNRQATLTEVEQKLVDALTTASKYQALSLDKEEELLKLETDISAKTAELKALSASLQTVRDSNEIEKAKICEEFAEKIQELNIQHQTLMRLKNEEVKNELAQMNAKLENERSKYLSVIETVQRS